MKEVGVWLVSICIFDLVGWMCCCSVLKFKLWLVVMMIFLLII